MDEEDEADFSVEHDVSEGKESENGEEESEDSASEERGKKSKAEEELRQKLKVAEGDAIGWDIRHLLASHWPSIDHPSIHGKHGIPGKHGVHRNQGIHGIHPRDPGIHGVQGIHGMHGIHGQPTSLSFMKGGQKALSSQASVSGSVYEY